MALFKKGKPNLSVTQLEFSGAVLFGSKALGVENSHSDVDMAIVAHNYYTLEKSFTSNVIQRPLDQYLNVYPPKGNNFMVRQKTSDPRIDLLVLENQSDVDIVQRAVEMIKDKPYLEHKRHRCYYYEQALLSLGWKECVNYNAQQPDDPIEDLPWI